MAGCLDTNLLRTFVAIADYGGFGRAGERLHFAQSTVSLQIRRLEEQLGAKLFRRDGRAMVVTEDGHKLLRYARRILALNEEAVTSVGSNRVTGHVRLGIIQDLTETVLSDLIEDFSRDFPNVGMEVVVANSGELDDGLSAGKLDIAIMAGEESERTPLFLREPLVWIGSERLDLRDQDTVPLVLCASPCGIRETAISLLEANGLAWRMAFTSPSLSGVKAAARAGFGITLRGASTLSPGLVRLGESHGLPTPPTFETVVKRSPHCLEAPAVDEMENFVGAFASQIS